MTLNEHAAIRHYITSLKFKKTLSNDYNGENQEFLLRKGWLSNDKNVQELLQNGYEQFRAMIAGRIIGDNPDEIYFNNYPKCEKLTRTSLAKKCRYCGYSWHKSFIL